MLPRHPHQGKRRTDRRTGERERVDTGQGDRGLGREYKFRVGLADLEATGRVAEDIFKFHNRDSGHYLQAIVQNALMDVVDRPQVDAMLAVLDRLIVS